MKGELIDGKEDVQTPTEILVTTLIMIISKEETTLLDQLEEGFLFLTFPRTTLILSFRKSLVSLGDLKNAVFIGIIWEIQEGLLKSSIIILGMPRTLLTT